MIVYTPEQNGTAERMNRTIVEKARCMLFDANLSVKYWAEAVATAVYIINRSPSRSSPDCKCPQKIWTGHTVSLKHLMVFGTIAMVHVPKQKEENLIRNLNSISW